MHHTEYLATIKDSARAGRLGGGRRVVVSSTQDAQRASCARAHRRRHHVGQSSGHHHRGADHRVGVCGDACGCDIKREIYTNVECGFGDVYSSTNSSALQKCLINIVHTSAPTARTARTSRTRPSNHVRNGLHPSRAPCHRTPRKPQVGPQAPRHGRQQCRHPSTCRPQGMSCLPICSRHHASSAPFTFHNRPRPLAS